MAVDRLVCCATELEASLLLSEVPVLITGVGAVNAAHALTCFMEREGADSVIVCGIGGAYPDSGLSVGDVAWASGECYGDLGANSPEGFLDMLALGFPLIAEPEKIYNRLPVSIAPSGAKTVPFVTVNTCTGDDASARALVKRTGGAVENMEGAAIAHVAKIYGIPMGEIRGISNPVGNRDRAAWRVREAAVNAQRTLLEAWKQL